MPLYEYVCNDCNSKFDALVASRDRADGVACATCAGDNTRRLVSTFARIGGFDDYAAAVQSTSTGGGGCCGGSCGCGCGH